MSDAKKIIKELVEFDPEFKKYEDTLLKVVSELLAARPDTKFDPEFARALKAKITAEPIVKQISFLSSMSRKYLIPVGAGLAVVAIVVALQLTQKGINGPMSVTTLSDGAHVTRLASGAFGSFSKNTSGSSGSEAVTNSAGPMAFGRGGGGGGVATGMAAASPMMAPTDQAVGKAMLYRPIYYKYVYKGDALELKDKTVDVLKRVKPSIDTSSAVGALKAFSFGGVDLSTFPGGQVTSYEIAQSGDGYTTNVNIRDGNLSISKNYEPMQCPKGVCPVQPQLRPSEVPSDEDIIAISNKFLKDHGLNLSNYGTPTIQDDWRKNLAAASSPGVAPYVPDFISVQYPWKINGTPITDLSGNPNGLGVNVDIRKKLVSGVWNITNQDYQSSAYDAETDANKVISIVENGGIYGNYSDPGAEQIEIDLGTPTRVYTSMWMNDGSGEVIVPALSFPVTKGPEGQYYYNKAIVVPLAKDLLQIPEPGPIRIMKGSVPPVSKDAAGAVEGSTGSAEASPAVVAPSATTY